MRLDKQSMLLYVVTDRSWLGGKKLEDQVPLIASSGATFIQLREKDLPYDAFLQEAVSMKAVTDRYQIPFVINDSVEVMKACGADGIHVGQKDMKASSVRHLIGPDKILGVSVQTVEQALEAQKQGADYIGVGAVFATSTKEDATEVSYETLKAICQAVSIPVVAIGGIGRDNIMKLSGSGVDGVAVISAIFAQPDVVEATREMRQLSEEMVNR